MYASASEHLEMLEAANLLYCVALSSYSAARKAYFETAKLYRRTFDPLAVDKLNKKLGVLFTEKQARLEEMKQAWKTLKQEMRVCNQNKAF